MLVLTCTAAYHALLHTSDSSLDCLRLDWGFVWLLWLLVAGLEVFCIGGGAAAASPEAQACRDANLTGLHELLEQVRAGGMGLVGVTPAQRVPLNG